MEIKINIPESDLSFLSLSLVAFLFVCLFVVVFSPPLLPLFSVCILYFILIYFCLDRLKNIIKAVVQK